MLTVRIFGFLSLFLLPSVAWSSEDTTMPASKSDESHRFVYYDNTLSNYTTASIVSLPYFVLTRSLEFTHQNRRGPKADQYNWLVDAARTMFVELPLVSYGFTIQHELGHGFRARDLGLEPRYSFGLPLPYSQLSEGQERLGYTDFRSEKFLTSEEQLLFENGGLEANVVHAKYLADVALVSDGMSRSESNLYFFSKLSTPLYGLYRKKGSNDVEGVTWQKNVRAKGMLNLLDPFVWNFFTSNSSYYSQREYQPDIPWLQVNQNFKLLPQLRYYLVPSGEAYEANFFTQLMAGTYNLTLSWWRFADPNESLPTPKRAFRVGLRILRYELRDALFLTGHLDVSRQSYFATGRWDQEKLVAAAGVGFEAHLSKSLACSFDVTRKDKGYFPEMTIHGGYIWKLGLSYPVL